jgi:putative transposase
MDGSFADVPDGLWREVAGLFPMVRCGSKGGRPRLANRRVFAGIVYRLRTGCQWKAMPRCFGSGSTCHSRFQTWREQGVFQRVFTRLLKLYDREHGIQWQWTCLDSASVKSPKGGRHRPKPY